MKERIKLKESEFAAYENRVAEMTDAQFAEEMQRREKVFKNQFRFVTRSGLATVAGSMGILGAGIIAGGTLALNSFWIAAETMGGIGLVGAGVAAGGYFASRYFNSYARMMRKVKKVEAMREEGVDRSDARYQKLSKQINASLEKMHNKRMITKREVELRKEQIALKAREMIAPVATKEISGEREMIAPVKFNPLANFVECVRARIDDMKTNPSYSYANNVDLYNQLAKNGSIIKVIVTDKNNKKSSVQMKVKGFDDTVAHIATVGEIRQRVEKGTMTYPIELDVTGRNAERQKLVDQNGEVVHKNKVIKNNEELFKLSEDVAQEAADNLNKLESERIKVADWLQFVHSRHQKMVDEEIASGKSQDDQAMTR